MSLPKIYNSASILSDLLTFFANMTPFPALINGRTYFCALFQTIPYQEHVTVHQQGQICYRYMTLTLSRFVAVTKKCKCDLMLGVWRV